ncbi:TetR/AcrR family transcriptional regulator [Rhizobium sp. LC145]|jgi:AcrR family transcriptional regulator|uniref:TetR/AcrR family transcriptional regulator n=1 Tax=Rhizobium sp. LC145 TaxID=1120688 RepID=UPI00062A49C6|nr:TetR/AcrR family transcriptional regulator [Rhizobium sp. LC145]KKX32894.1 transcriptional regulator [Rhizobium sp. LC145]TKT57307.1 TetR/AcrR family transcriptional regulator [Rhizobiaceae bacterium LC148]
MVQRAENARERFESAAYELFGRQGYAETTVPEIASKAGLTERTFYRYFTDKREVLFWRAGAHQTSITKEIAKAPTGEHPLSIVASSFEAVAPFIDSHRPIVKLRQFLISTHSDLHERELMKLHMLASAIDMALQQRGIQPSLSRVIAEIGAALWKVALQNWRADEGEESFARHVQATLAEFQAGLNQFAG